MPVDVFGPRVGEGPCHGCGNDNCQAGPKAQVNDDVGRHPHGGKHPVVKEGNHDNSSPYAEISTQETDGGPKEGELENIEKGDVQ